MAGPNSKFAHRIPAYLQNCRLNVAAMQQALDQVDLETVARIGHQLGGFGGMFGFQAISEIGSALQQAAKNYDVVVVANLIGELARYLDGVEIKPDPPA
jgi:HPt (histidine-containing phosphotransfer) domain-containing protein